MLHHLLESRARPRGQRAGTRAGTAASVVAHAAVIGAAVAATGRAALRPEPAPTEVLVFRPAAPERTLPASRPGPTAAGPAHPTAPRAPAPALPQLPGPEVPAVDVALPDVGRAALDDPGQFAGRGVGAAAGDGGGALGADGAAVAAELVDEPIVPDARNPLPRYPAALRDAGVGGRVVARFVVDTLGRVEAGSVEFVAPGDPRFEAAAREALARARFRPARAGGRRVRQLAERPFAWAPAGAPGGR